MPVCIDDNGCRDEGESDSEKKFFQRPNLVVVIAGFQYMPRAGGPKMVRDSSASLRMTEWRLATLQNSHEFALFATGMGAGRDPFALDSEIFGEKFFEFFCAHSVGRAVFVVVGIDEKDGQHLAVRFE